jgi:hypothetical protein
MLPIITTILSGRLKWVVLALGLALALWVMVSRYKAGIVEQVHQEIRQEERAQTAEKTLEARKEAEKIKEEVRGLSDEELADYFRTGNLPERLRESGAHR